MLQRESCLLQSRGNLHSLEITSVMDSLGFSLNKRIVGSRVHLDSQRLDGAEDVFETWSDPLSSGSVESERRQREEVSVSVIDDVLQTSQQSVEKVRKLTSKDIYLV